MGRAKKQQGKANEVGRRRTDSEEEDYKAYQNRLLLQWLAGILAEKGELTLEDLENLMRNKIAVFNEFDSEDFKAFQNILLLQRLEGILAEKGDSIHE